MVPEAVSSHKAWASDSYANINNSSHNMFFSLRKLVLWQGILSFKLVTDVFSFFPLFAPIFWKAVTAYEKANALRNAVLAIWLIAVPKDCSNIPASGSAAFLYLFISSFPISLYNCQTCKPHLNLCLCSKILYQFSS